VTDSEAPYPTCLRFLPCCGTDQSTVENYTCLNPQYVGESSRSSNAHSRGRTELRGACVPTPVPLPGCFCRDPLVHEVTKINLLFAFCPCCGCSCVLPLSAHTSSNADSQKGFSVVRLSKEIWFYSQYVSLSALLLFQNGNYV